MEGTPCIVFRQSCVDVIGPADVVTSWIRVFSESHAYEAEVVAGVRRLTHADHAAVLGALVLARELRRVEVEIGGVIEDYRAAFQGRSDGLFEPALRTEPGGTIRVYWGYPEHCQTKDGPRFITRHIPGRPTDRWMRSIGIPERARRAVGVFVKRLVPLQREYARLVAFLARRRRAVGALLARIAARESSGAVPLLFGRVSVSSDLDQTPLDPPFPSRSQTVPTRPATCCMDAREPFNPRLRYESPCGGE